MRSSTFANPAFTNIPGTLEPIVQIPRVKTLRDAQPQESEDLLVMEINVPTTAKQIALPDHNHIVISNRGANYLQYSKDGQNFLNWINSGETFALDGHREKFFYLQAPAGAITITLTLWTWTPR